MSSCADRQGGSSRRSCRVQGIFIMILLVGTLGVFTDWQHQVRRKAPTGQVIKIGMPGDSLRVNDAVNGAPSKRGEGDEHAPAPITETNLQEATENETNVLNVSEARSIMLRPTFVGEQFRRLKIANGTHHDAADDEEGSGACGPDVKARILKRIQDGERFITTAPVHGGYGFTNQMISHAALIAYSVADNRTIIWPPSKTHVLDLVSLRHSNFHGHEFRALNRCEAAIAVPIVCGTGMVMMKNDKFLNLRKRLPRSVFTSHPDYAAALYGKFMQKTKRYQTVQLWAMYQRWPFGAFASYTMPSMMCSVHFTETLEQQVAAGYRRLAAKVVTFESNRNESTYTGTSEVAEYLAIHLRMEPQDMFSVGRSWSNTSQVSTFFRSTIFPLAAKNGLRAVLLGSGPLDPDVEAAIHTTAEEEGFLIMRKGDFNLTVPHEPVALGHNKGHTMATTNTFGSVIDVLLMERAAVLVLTTFSSLSAALYSRRCCAEFTRLGAASYDKSASAFSLFGGGPREGKVYVYDVYQDGTLTDLLPYPCGYRMGEFLHGYTIPEPPEQLNVFNGNGSSALFPQRHHQQGAFIFPPNVQGIKPRRKR